MKQRQLKIDGSQVIISVRKAPVFIKIVLIGIFSILLLMPLAVTVFSLTYGDGPHIGIVFSFILCWGVGFYLLRVILWNSVGREILMLNADGISYVADYKLFKDGRKEIGTKELVAEIIYEDEPNKPFGRLRLRSEKAVLETSIKVSIEELSELKSEIEALYDTK